MIIRPVEKKDFEQFYKLTSAGTLGITNLPKEKHLIEQRINLSLNSFRPGITKPYSEVYTFVLEDEKTGELGGICGIISRLGVTAPVFYYTVDTIKSYNVDHLVVPEMKVLRPVSYDIGPSEVCALFIKPSFRKEGLGRLLSLGRFLFIAAFQERFGTYFIAEMRGDIDSNQESAFWNGIGRKFLNMDYSTLTTHLESNREFIPYVLPKWPIYIDLLPKSVQDSIGKIHRDTKPALKMLKEEGFEESNYLDLFDGGPIIQATTSEIRCVKQSQKAQVTKISNKVESPQFLVGNDRLDFRIAYGFVEGFDEVTITKELAHQLGVQKGDFIRYVLPHA